MIDTRGILVLADPDYRVKNTPLCFGLMIRLDPA